MEVYLTPHQESGLNELATATGRGTDQLVQEAVDRLLAYNTWFKEQVQVGLDQMSQDEFVDDEEVLARIERMFQSRYCIRWTSAASADLEQIGFYLKDHNPQVARRTVLRLYEAALSLKRFPNRGRAGSQAGTRELVIPSLPYVIVYQVAGETVHIARVVHGAQDWQG